MARGREIDSEPAKKLIRELICRSCGTCEGRRGKSRVNLHIEAETAFNLHLLKRSRSA